MRPIILLLLAAFLLLAAPCLSASPLPPLVRASRSANGKFLVVTSYEFAHPGDTSGQIARTIYHVWQLEDFINRKDHIETPSPFWSDSWQSWDLTLEGPLSYAWPMVSDDGLSLVLVSVSFPMPGVPVLKLFRKTPSSHTGQLVRSYAITDLWTKREIDPAGTGMIGGTDASPQWFSGGTLAFSANSKSLTYKNQWNETLNINLQTGAISRTP